MRCECECGHEALVTLKDNKYDDKDFIICYNCLNDLILLSLSKSQYKALLTNGHNTNEFLLHDDFYDDEGNALQPKEVEQI